MSNFPNMSYCAWENTSKAMDQLAEMLQAALDCNEPMDLNRYEMPHYRSMREKCSALIELIEQHDELVESVNHNDDEEIVEE